MHFLVIGINYAPEIIGIGESTTELCEYLVSKGHKVSMLTTFPHYPEWKTWETYRGKIFMHEIINGVLVYRGYTLVPRRPTIAVHRIIFDISFAILTFILGLAIRNVELILVISPPLEGGLSAYLLAKIKRAKFVLQVKDVVPDLAINLGILKSPLIIKLAKALERFVYSKAEAILVICRGFVGNIKSKGVASSKIVLLSNWVDLNRIQPFQKNNLFRQEHNFNEKFLILHSGNMGAKQKLENVIETAKHLSDLKDILFLLAGEGPMKKFLEKKASGLSNIQFISLQPRNTFPHMLAAADILLLNQSATVVDMVLPYKLLNYMSAGRPIVASVNANSETARYIRWADCGFIVSPEQPQALAEAVQRIYVDRELGIRFGRNGRNFAEKNFARERTLNSYLDFFEKFVNK